METRWGTHAGVGLSPFQRGHLTELPDSVKLWTLRMRHVHASRRQRDDRHGRHDHFDATMDTSTIDPDMCCWIVFQYGSAIEPYGF